MLTVKEIRKVFDNFEVEGFTYFGDGEYKDSGFSSIWWDHKYKLSIWWNNEEENKLSLKNPLYPLFLQRVIEGVNRSEGDFYIEIGINNCVDVVSLEDGADFKIYQNKNIDQAKEQAIKYILEQL